jgi:hypothetical protein
MRGIHEAANALAFIAISQNEYLKQDARYFNSSYFQVYFQRFSPKMISRGNAGL